MKNANDNDSRKKQQQQQQTFIEIVITTTTGFQSNFNQTICDRRRHMWKYDTMAITLVRSRFALGHKPLLIGLAQAISYERP